jgi:hypothetical protein
MVGRGNKRVLHPLSTITYRGPPNIRTTPYKDRGEIQIEDRGYKDRGEILVVLIEQIA